MTELIPASACMVFTNDTCICTDPTLYAEIEACLTSSCTVIEALSKYIGAIKHLVGDSRLTPETAVANIEAEACGTPVRSRKVSNGDSGLIKLYLANHDQRMYSGVSSQSKHLPSSASYFDSGLDGDKTFGSLTTI